VTDAGFSRPCSCGPDVTERIDLASYPRRVRWRYTLRPAWLRVAINRTWRGRWSAEEIADINRRAAEDAARMRELAE